MHRKHNLKNELFLLPSYFLYAQNLNISEYKLDAEGYLKHICNT